MEIDDKKIKNSLFSVVEPEIVDSSQMADRILSRVLVDLSAMRDIALRVATAPTSEQGRCRYQQEIGKLKEDISNLTKALSAIRRDVPGMTEEEYSKSMEAIGASMAQSREIFAKSGLETPAVKPDDELADEESFAQSDKRIAGWFDEMMKKSAGEDDTSS